jgi:hypothetical protein
MSRSVLRGRGDREDGAKVTEVVLPRLRLYGEALSESDHVLAPDLGAFHLGDVVLVLDRSENLLLGAPDLGRFLDVALDHVPQRWVFKGERERAWFPQLRFPAVQPRFRSLLAIEGLGFPVDDLSSLASGRSVRDTPATRSCACAELWFP